VDDYHNKATLVFQDCKDCHYTLTEICTKVFVQNCENLTLTINATVVTSAVEAYKTKGLKIHANKRVHMFQADICEVGIGRGVLKTWAAIGALCLPLPLDWFFGKFVFVVTSSMEAT
jgi:hypothetical protein